MVWEKAFNTKAVIGWREDPATVVISFRGTASASNLFADLQVWRTRHPKDVGQPLLGTAPMVHFGFQKAYTSNNFNDRLLNKVMHILNRCQQARTDTASLNRPPVKVYLTGHSLGGALAILCAYDIATRTPCAEYDIDTSCYTFGAPRVGNHAFARLYNNKVPDTWTMINSDDVITRAGKFLFLFKHVGHRVLLNRRGDLVVRPSFVEYSIRRSPGGSLKDHYLTSYERAVVAVVAAQFGTKAYAGSEGVVALTESARTRAVLRQAGLSLEDVQRLQEGRGELARQRMRRGVSERRGAAAAPTMSLVGRCLAALERVSAKISGRRDLETIAMSDDSSSAGGSRKGLVDVQDVEIGSAEEGLTSTAADTDTLPTKKAVDVSKTTQMDGGEDKTPPFGDGCSSAPGQVEDRFEARLQATTGLQLCQEMCTKMGAPRPRCSAGNYAKNGRARRGQVEVERTSAPSRINSKPSGTPNKERREE